jgi:hypothetical protein
MTEVEREAAQIAGNAFHDLTTVLDAAAKQLTAAAELMKADGGRASMADVTDEAKQKMVAQVVREAIGSVKWFAHEIIHCDDSPPKVERWVATEVLSRRMNRVLGIPLLSKEAKEYVNG